MSPISHTAFAAGCTPDIKRQLHQNHPETINGKIANERVQKNKEDKRTTN